MGLISSRPSRGQLLQGAARAALVVTTALACLAVWAGTSGEATAQDGTNATQVSGSVHRPPGFSDELAVEATAPDGQSLRTPVDSRGAYTLMVPADWPAGDYILGVVPPRLQRCERATVTITGAWFPPQPVELTPGSRVTVDLAYRLLSWHPSLVPGERNCPQQ
jgi:hypothetical protein